MEWGGVNVIPRTTVVIAQKSGYLKKVHTGPLPARSVLVYSSWQNTLFHLRLRR